jgi:hypothetical protein
VLKLNSDGNLLDSWTIEGEGRHVAKDSGLDAAGNLYILGRFQLETHLPNGHSLIDVDGNPDGFLMRLTVHDVLFADRPENGQNNLRLEDWRHDRFTSNRRATVATDAELAMAQSSVAPQLAPFTAKPIDAVFALWRRGDEHTTERPDGDERPDGGRTGTVWEH